MQDTLIAFSAYVFLAGIVMVSLYVFESIRKRYPKILLHGFLVAILSFVLVGIAALFF